MSDTDKFQDRAMEVINEVFSGEHHVFSLKWQGDVCQFLINEGAATYDFSELTRLVVWKYAKHARRKLGKRK